MRALASLTQFLKESNVEETDIVSQSSQIFQRSRSCKMSMKIMCLNF